MDEIRNWVLNIAAIAVLMIILDLLMPEGKTKSFTQLVAGFVVMFAMINPVLRLIDKGVPASYAGWQDEFYLLNTRFKYTTRYAGEEQQRHILDLYRTLLVSDIKNRLESNKNISEAEVDVVLNENPSSDRFGEIRKLYLNLIVSEPAEFDGVNRHLAGEIRRELRQALSLDEDKIIIHITKKN
ncbi:stage III sporulation protein AF [Thermoclostridium stercorarium subsp. stercorarium DSM 8532]|jgi:stage III sporulation protein AF|uniref:Stage III sporulation protein AF n=3 Tax=Thermoclostridium stercorarium TaxID=1510 RepID=L7VPP9_THES1|nr:stage III sporulation protein AF [Thermoclostridium stercorarium]AGC67558.1 stage III sporulation protein AF [Thermoclostridium stercorarium subsp. stercorarium DSM 8532]AGI38607.1 sporulation protein 3AF [Thermoclostridium stercorarium subsp. stercorarium DSM 8532]ANW97982.1 stage III sporulation protein AF [Thermoclostridium stercorarium subsp. thermolacticum DSM 2910]ANX00532.1 stage III sporulation protein AF [Thermoclostridium stercorarium subsp. leptospartum DSM 9219]UZQ86143.1 stage 